MKTACLLAALSLMACGDDDRAPADGDAQGDTVDHDGNGDGGDAAPDDPNLAPVGNYGWDGATCPEGTSLVSHPADDPNARFCADGDTRHGPFGRWHEGLPAVMVEGGQYASGVPTGTWRTWYPGGSQRDEGARDADGRTGAWRSWRADRTRESEGDYAADQREGAWVFYWPDGGVEARGDYRAGEEHGAWSTFYPEGGPDETLSYAAGVLDGPYTKVHPSGDEAIEGTYDDGLRTGTWTTWYPDGVMASRGDYDLGLQTGTWTTWDNEGREMSRGPYVAGVQAGVWSIWSWQDGERIASTGDVIDGQPHGPWVITFDPGGEPAGQLTYFQGSREGASETLWRNGETRSEGDYYRNLPEGAWRFFYPNGQLFIDCTMDRGRFVGEYREYYDDGSPKAEGEYTWDGYKTGVWTYWDADGDVRTCHHGVEQC